MGTYEEEIMAQIYTETLVKLAILEDKYHIPENQRVTTYKEVNGYDGTSETYPIPKDEKAQKEVFAFYDSLKMLDEARNENHLLVGSEYSKLAERYTLETIFNIFSKEQKEIIANDIELYGGIFFDEGEQPLAKLDDTMDKLIDMVMSERNKLICQSC